jgi:putative tryptophan/tyrosine transport system substrate-binding protein
MIVVDGGSAVPPTMAETKTIPIVMATAGDPIALGYVSNLARPGGNVTGFTLISNELNLKRLDLLRTTFPLAWGITLFLNPLNATAVAGTRAITEAAGKLGVRIARRELPTPEAIEALRSEQLDPKMPVLVVPDAMFWNHRKDLIRKIERQGLSGLYPEREYADDGGLMAYGPNVPDNFRRAAGYVDRVLKGTKPGDLPIQQPAKFDFVINMRTARLVGVALPQSILAGADEIID